MNSEIKLNSKFLLSGNTLRLFLVSVTSTFLRYGSVFAVLYGAFLFHGSAFFKNALAKYNSIGIYTAFILATVIVLTAALIFSAAVKGGEELIFFTRAQGSKGRFSLLFKYFHLRKALAFFRLYLKTSCLKFIWLIYFLLPFLFCSACSYYLYSTDHLSNAVYVILCAGASLLLSVSLIMWRVSALRYSAAPYYLCLNTQRGVNYVIEKSIRFTDGYLTDGIVLEYSFLGWLLSCIFIVPIIYVVPYLKLSRAAYVSYAVTENAPKVKLTYAISFLRSGEHID